MDVSVYVQPPSDLMVVHKLDVDRVAEKILSEVRVAFTVLVRKTASDVVLLVCHAGYVSNIGRYG